MFAIHNARRAFTLLELLVVLPAIGILVAIAVPSYNAVRGNAAQRAATTTAQHIGRNAEAIAAIQGRSLVSLDDLRVSVAEAGFAEGAEAVDGLEEFATDGEDGSFIVRSGTNPQREATVVLNGGVLTIVSGGSEEPLAFVPAVVSHQAPFNHPHGIRVVWNFDIGEWDSIEVSDAFYANSLNCGEGDQGDSLTIQGVPLMDGSAMSNAYLIAVGHPDFGGPAEFGVFLTGTDGFDALYMAAGAVVVDGVGNDVMCINNPF